MPSGAIFVCSARAFFRSAVVADSEMFTLPLHLRACQCVAGDVGCVPASALLLHVQRHVSHRAVADECARHTPVSQENVLARPEH